MCSNHISTSEELEAIETMCPHCRAKLNECVPFKRQGDLFLKKGEWENTPTFCSACKKTINVVFIKMPPKIITVSSSE